MNWKLLLLTFTCFFASIASANAESIADVQKRRHERTEYLRQLARMETELFRPFVWKATAFVPTRPVTMMSAYRQRDAMQTARDERTGVKTEFSQLTLRDMLKMADTRSCEGRRPRVPVSESAPISEP